MKSSRKHKLVAVPIFCMLLLFLSRINATEFGMNKVQYQKFDFNYLQSKHFDIYFNSKHKDIASFTADWAETCYNSLSADIHHKLGKRIPVVVYGSHGQFEQTNVITEMLPEGVGGFTELFKNRVVVPFERSYDDFRHVLRHELAHAVVFDLIYGGFGSLLMQQRLRLPLWFFEGLAEYESLGWDIEADAYIMDFVVHGAIPSPEEDFGGFMAYKGGQSFFNYLAQVYGKESIAKLLHRANRSNNFSEAFKRVYGEPLEKIGEDWAIFLRQSYWPEVGRRENMEKKAERLTYHIKDQSNFNLQPSFSPDGKQVAFFSDRKDYTNIYILSTEDKKKAVTDIATEGKSDYIESFHPFYSGISWSPDGLRLMLVTRAGGNEYLSIFDLQKKKMTERILVDLEAVFSPDWSPDGKYAVFSGVVHGQTDLYLLDLSTKKVSRLTADLASDNHPRFSPDGSMIIFDSESLDDTLSQKLLKRSGYDIYMIRVDGSGAQRLTVNPFDDKCPTWSPDGKKIIFTSNRNGLDNLYMLKLDSVGAEKPLTDVLGSCQTPCWARNSNKLVLSLFQSGGWDVWLMKEPESKIISSSLPPTRFVGSLLDTALKFFPKEAMTPPAEKPDTTADTAQAPLRMKMGNKKMKSLAIFPDTTEPETTVKAESATGDTAIFFQDTLSYKTNTGAYRSYPYALKFSPDLVSVALVASNYYGAAGHGAVVFSDILGNHRITLAGDLYQSNVGTSNVFFSYFYLRHRINMGIAGFFSREWASASQVDMADYFLDQHYGGVIIAQYPFSMISRLECSLLGISIGRKPYNVTENGDVAENDSISSQNVYTILPKAALVRDNIIWGNTGPVNGMRGRIDFTLGPDFKQNDYRFWMLTADVRKYYHLWKKYSFAFRIAAGRSEALGGGTDPANFFVGGDDNGLFFPEPNNNNFDYSINDRYFSDLITPLRGASYFDMKGNKYFLGNFEFRYPFVRNITFVWPLPMELRYISGALFMDAGSAWSNTYDWTPITVEDGWLKLQDSKMGIGVGFRMNLGIFVARFDKAWGFDFSSIAEKPMTYLSIGAEF